MLNNRKIRLMTRLAIYEKDEGKEDIRLSKYFRMDYIRVHLLNNLVAVTVGYLLLLLMIGGYKMEYLIREAVQLDYIGIGKKILGIYLIVLVIYVVATTLGYSLYYSQSRKKLAKYFRMLRKLRSIYREEDGEEDKEEE